MLIRTCLILLLAHLVHFAGAADFVVRTDGTILKNGTPFFPHGFYSEQGGYTEAQGLTELDTIAGGGFNFVQLKNNDVPANPSAGYYPLYSLLNRCASKGLWVVLGTTSGNITDGTQEAYVDQSAIMAWELSDDGDDGRWTLAQAQARAATVRAVDPKRLTFLSLTGYTQSRRDAAADWCSVTQLGGLQVYPIQPPPDYGVGPDQVLAESYRRNVLYVDAAAQSGHAIVTTLQTFSWAVVGDSVPNPRYPTPLESRNMTYASIAAGAKGLIGFTFRGLLTQPALWDELKQQAVEVSTLAPVLMDGTRTRLSTGNPWLAATTWRQGDQLTVVVVNLSTAADQTVSLAMPSGANSLQTMFPGRPASLGISDGNLVGTMGAATVQVYRMSLTAPLNLPPTVSLSAPVSGTAGSALELSATAADSDGIIAKVEFFIGSTLLATDTTSPYAATWTPGAAGTFSVTAKATDNLGAATVSSAQTVVISAAAAGAGTGLTGTYFSDMNFANAVVTRTDTTVDFDWGTGAPASGVAADGFSVRWVGQVQAQFSETYTFTTLSDDGVRLWVNGQQLINNWTDHGPTENSGTITLVSGQKYDLKMEFFENGGGAVAKLSWASPSTIKQIIPTTQLFPSSISVALPAGWTAQDIGGVALGGSTTHSNGTWTISGSGADIWNNADGCRFVSQRVTGDVQVTAQVSGLTNTDVWAKAGVMIRESLTAGSRHASTFATAANGLAYQRRLATDGVSSHTAGPGSAAPYWVRIERLGNVVISSTSPNGTTWTELRRETIAMSAAVYVGLAVTSHNNGALCTGTFTNVQVVGVAAAAN